MKLLIDTHILVWLATNPDELSVKERAALIDPDNDIIVSAVSLWELRTKARAERRRGKAELTLFPPEAIAFCDANGIAIRPLKIEDCAVALRVEPSNNDPFDEMLIVHAQQLGARLLTRDEHLVRHPLAYHPSLA